LIVTVTLNATLSVSYQASSLVPDKEGELTRARYRASGRGVTVARVLQTFGHDVLTCGLAGGTAGELISADLARSGVESDFTRIGRESRRAFRIQERETGRVLRLREPGPYVTTEELGRFAADFRRRMEDATAVVLCGTLPPGLPTEIYGSLVSYAAAAGVPAVVDADDEELRHGARRRPQLAITAGADAVGPAAVVRVADGQVAVRTQEGGWAARLAGGAELSRGALVAGLVPGELLDWSWPDRLRHALALAASTGTSGEVDLADYEELLTGDAIEVSRS
jgi:tagatose 6-phosphate kinase